LEDQFDRSLHQPGSSRTHDVSERCAIDVAVHRSRSVELGVVENVKSLETELQRLGLTERNALQQRHVVVVDAWAVEETPLGVARLSQGLETEKAGIEIGLAVARVAVQSERTRSVLWLVDAIVVDAVGLRSQQ